ncbi:alpha/beta hydrolase [Bacillus sp. CRN 9]|nr:alpha/beta hydrolase [Bacillus sp. CRN 9]
MADCKVPQAEIHYEEFGEGKPIIMLHGFSLDHRVMSGCMEPIFTNRNGWRRIYIDLPGMGRSKRYNNIESSDDMLDAVLQFIQLKLPNQDYLVAGESYGGYIARGIIERCKKNVLGAAFICPLIVPKMENRRIDKHKILKTDHQFIQTLSNQEKEEFEHVNVVLNEDSWLRYKNEIQAGSKLADEQLLIKVKSNYEFSFEIDQSKFEKPSVFLLGRQDASVGFIDALEIINKYPRGTFAVVDTSGHNLQIEQPDIFNTLINEWLDRMEDYLN